jgi:8-oxo-dGTP pyrophosphatase MutT (NUDIX family)
MVKRYYSKTNAPEWDLAGGRIELGETPENCLIREFQEETSVNVKIEAIIDSYLFEVIPGKHVFIMTYGCN